MQDNDIQGLYRARFSGDKELQGRNRIWKVLCNSFFNKLIPDNSHVLDIGSGYCEFINNIKAVKKTGIDINPETKQFAADDVDILKIDCTTMENIGNESYDIVFSSNFLEHLPGKEEVLQTLQQSFRVLKPGGSLILLGPNIKYLSKDYWDFFDHKVPLSHLSLEEILLSIGFNIEKNYAKFLPYTTKSRIPKADIFIKIYLKVPLLYRLFGKQFLIIAGKKQNG